MAPKIIYQTPQWDSGGIYNREVVFKLEQYGLVKMIFLVFECTPDAAADYPLPSSPYLIQNVALESFGNPIAHNTTSYILGRMDEVDVDLYNQMADGCNFKGTFDSAQTVSLPLFFWCIDGQMLDTFKYPNLTIRCQTKSSALQMGLTEELVAMNIKLKVLYDQPSKGVGIPRELKNPYNVYRITVPSIRSITDAVETRTVKLNVPYEVCNLYFMLRLEDNAAVKGIVKSVKLSTPTHEIGVFDDITNYYLGERNSANSGNTFAIQLASRYAKRDDYLNFNGSQNPTLAEVSFIGGAGNYTLFVAFEYYSNIIESDGMLLEDNTRSFVRG